MANNTVPRFFALHAAINSKYLCYRHEEGEANKHIQFVSDQILSPYTKFEAVKANTGNGLLHIRCCYNNKYWAKRPTTNYLAATADEPEEDQSKWTCTLFEPLFIDAKTLRFRHVQLGRYACLWRTDPPHYASVSLAGSNTDNYQCDVYTIIDWESLMILPKHIALKGDNGLYLSAQSTNGQPFHLFAATDIGDPTVGLEVFTTGDGNIRISSNFFQKFWRLADNWILADSTDTTSSDSKTVFSPVKLENNIVALRNLGNNKFCKRLTGRGITNGIAATTATISNEARMEVEEVVLLRKIYYVDFRLTDAKIYDQKVITLAYGSADNKTQETKIVEVKFSYTDAKSSTWNSSASVKLYSNSTIQSDIPVIGNDGKVQVSDKFTGIYQWGKTESSTNIVGTTYNVALPPMTTMRVTLLATKGSCDVPFSYTQRDILLTGEHIVYDMDDGVYTGVNYFNFKFEVKQESLA